ncbi:phosphoribosylamine--glycine ligase [Oceanobacillus limi]|uniref:Phosphoribosylamine--glycine ligase n=1 Tax=Oceanobacillus limi TaxID=930131 RepID=A0A1I0E2W5_9BACI|nr:phosphoribosylamine--glycine ligase [Oceanobacillus limi]SET39433.1 phosphoribosylamine--glycine ligase [Oceanobacillus limi]
MNVLVIGRGGREHSMVLKLAGSEQINQLYVAPGNGGMEEVATCLPIEETDIDRLVDFVTENAIDFTVVGPENPLLEGIANRFHEEGLDIFAPTKEAALIEGSKQFSKAFMERHHIPTAAYESFTNAEDAKSYLEQRGVPIVIKADGLAAGKGVIVAETKEEAMRAIDEMLVTGTFAEAGKSIVIEEFLQGREFSLMAFVNGKNVYPMIPARDHKRAFENDEGPNTGGMGAYAPVSDITDDVLAFATEAILQKAADGLVEENRSFTGILYAGLMMTESGPKVIEFNARFGDPETQVVLPLLKNDLLQVMVDVMNGNDPRLDWESKSCFGVVLASKGYPGAYLKNVPVPVVAPDDKSFPVYAGVKNGPNGYLSDGGRVLLIGAKSEMLSDASDAVYRSLSKMSGTDEFFYRKDIGKVAKDT